MAFVFRESREKSPHQTSQLGPGAYDQPPPHAIAPLISPNPNRFQNFKEDTPGPGAYQVTCQHTPKQVIANGDNFMCLHQIYNVFDSNRRRVLARSTSNIVNSPEDGRVPRVQFKMNAALAQIIKRNRQFSQRVQSIPNITYERQPKTRPLKSIKDRIKLRSYKNTEASSVISDFSTPGPGHYNLQSKPCPPKFLGEYKQKAQSTRVNDSQCSQEEEQQYQFVENCTPGPGYYNFEASKQKFISNRKIKLHKSKAVFTKEEASPGPGQYDLRKKELKVRQNMYGFNSQEAKMGKDEQVSEQPLMPRGYTINQNLIQNLYKGYVGSFGSKVQRFRVRRPLAPDIGSYQLSEAKSTKIPVFPKQKRFKSISNHVPGVGHYNFQENSVQIFDNDLKPKKPPLGGSVQRFSNAPQDLSDYDPVLDRAHKLLDDKKRRQVSFAKAERFGKQKQQTPFPGYENLERGWVKRSFNICFANCPSPEAYSHL